MSEAQQDHHDDDDGRVTSGLVLRTLHRVRQPEVQQIDAVNAGHQHDEETDEGHQHRDAGDPRCRVTVGNRLQCLHPVLGAAETRRKRFHDQRDDEHHRQRQRVSHDQLRQREARREAHGDEERGQRRNRREPDDVALVEIRDRGRLAGDQRPLGLGGQQNALDACDQLVEVHGRSPRLSLFGTRGFYVTSFSARTGR